eukprot:scaffold45268_cov39-Phaeocystis_antarctica.AAC.2
MSSRSHELPPAALLLEVGLVFVLGGQLRLASRSSARRAVQPRSGASPPVSGLCKLRLHPHPTGRVQSCRTLPQHLPSPSYGPRENRDGCVLLLDVLVALKPRTRMQEAHAAPRNGYSNIWARSAGSGGGA